MLSTMEVGIRINGPAGADMACLIPLGRLSEAQRAAVGEKLTAASA
jgi:hypothetical protein